MNICRILKHVVVYFSYMNNTTLNNVTIEHQKPKPTYRNIGLTQSAVEDLRFAELMVYDKSNYKPTHSEMICLMVRAYIPYLKSLPQNYNIMTDITNRNLSLQ